MELQRKVKHGGTMRKGACKHFTGLMSKQCDLSVNYHKLAGGSMPGWASKLPCYPAKLGSNIERVSCEKYEEPSDVEIAEFEKQITEMTKRFEAVFPLVKQVKEEHKGTDWKGVMECPVCKKRLVMLHSGYNGHVWGQCETRGCLSWME